jgi:cell division transport system permease protein
MNATERDFSGASPVQEKRKKRSRILPREEGAASLDLVIAVMAFLAALALGAVLIAERAAATWEAGLLGRFTVQILPEGAGPPEGEVKAALDLLRATPGVASAQPLSDADNLALIEPFLGRDPVVAALPFPRLIDVEIQPGATPDLTALATKLKSAAPHSILDDHGRWVGRLRSAANAIVYAALAVLALIAIGTASTVAFATRAGLATHREIVELLHLMGARDRFIAGAFERHYMIAFGFASLAGTVFAAVVFYGANGLETIGLANVSFLPPLGLPAAELPWLLLVPLGAALIAWATARLSVIAALHELY